MITANIFKEVNNLVYTTELSKNGKYLESFYSKYKYQAVNHCKENNYIIEQM